jgi:RNA polymerase sigma factor (TIGR02999 family)
VSAGTPEGPIDPREIAVLLQAASEGDSRALDELFDALYEELRRLAHAQRARWQGDTTLNTTALVHEAYLKLSRARRMTVVDRGHFFALASRAMRQVLVTYAERRRAQKRGGDAAVIPLDEANPVSSEQAGEILAIHRALDRLANVSERPVRVVECRFFAGLSVPETAEALGVSAATVKRDWTMASAWLRAELAELGVDGAYES